MKTSIKIEYFTQRHNSDNQNIRQRSCDKLSPPQSFDI